MSESTEYEPPAGLPPHLSPSQINGIMTCGEQFRLERIVRVPSRPMFAAIGGTCVHKITEKLDREWYVERNFEEVEREQDNPETR